jgi:hypothetical protein
MDIDQKGVSYFQEHGFEVVHVSHLMPPIDVPHPNTGSVASPAEIYEWVRSHSSAQAVLIGGNALRSIGAIAALEEDLRRPILTANQVSLWYALRVASAEVTVNDYGPKLGHVGQDVAARRCLHRADDVDRCSNAPDTAAGPVPSMVEVVNQGRTRDGSAARP